jgi:hypothetical protein
MKSDRRRFIATAGATATGLLTGGISPVKGNGSYQSDHFIQDATEHRQHFNMCGYAAPKLEKVRIGIIGVGNRGLAAVDRLKLIEGVEIRALCDKRTGRVEMGQKSLNDSGLPLAKSYSGSEEIWKEVCSDNGLDLIYICTPWSLHTPLAVKAMENGKHAAAEVPAVVTLDDAWQLVETSERTRKHCMMLENCCYDFFEMLTLNMIRQGFFGELIHAEAGYIHNLLEFNFKKDLSNDMWRLKEIQHRNGNLYPTHGLGPLCQAMDINRGERMTFLTSVSTNDFQMGKKAAGLAREDSFFDQFNTNSYCGNMNNTIIRTEKGRTILLHYDITSPRPYSRIHLISGTGGCAMKYPEPPRISQGDEWFSDDSMKQLWNQYTPEIVKRIGEMAKKVGGHGGMDFLMDWRLIDCLRNGLPLDQDVYDAALWSSIVPLSEWSVANGSKPIMIPDFTCGSYKTNKPVDINLSKGGSTGVIEIPEKN